jgi:hypothetical protein
MTMFWVAYEDISMVIPSELVEFAIAEIRDIHGDVTPTITPIRPDLEEDS